MSEYIVRYICSEVLSICFSVIFSFSLIIHHMLLPDIRFNAGVMLIRPSIAVYNDILSKANTGEITSYDGGDTGLLNAYYSDWFASMPSSARLPFGYNAQRFMYNCTFGKRPQYWNEGVVGIGGKDSTDGKVGKGGLYIIHYSSCPKPWEELERRTNSSKDAAKGFLDADSASTVSKTTTTELDKLWEEQYRKAQAYYYENDMKNAVNRKRKEEAERRAKEEKKNAQLLLEKKRAEASIRMQLLIRIKMISLYIRELANATRNLGGRG